MFKEYSNRSPDCGWGIRYSRFLVDRCHMLPCWIWVTERPVLLWVNWRASVPVCVQRWRCWCHTGCLDTAHALQLRTPFGLSHTHSHTHTVLRGGTQWHSYPHCKPSPHCVWTWPWPELDCTGLQACYIIYKRCHLPWVSLSSRTQCSKRVDQLHSNCEANQTHPGYVQIVLSHWSMLFSSRSAG